jgi:hypothetical protein
MMTEMPSRSFWVFSPEQCCQMVYFKTTLSFYGQTEYFMATWYIFPRFGIPRKIWQPWSRDSKYFTNAMVVAARSEFETRCARCRSRHIRKLHVLAMASRHGQNLIPGVSPELPDFSWYNMPKRVKYTK